MLVKWGTDALVSMLKAAMYGLSIKPSEMVNSSVIPVDRIFHMAQMKDESLMSRHKPSVDVLFRSISKSAGKNVWE